MSPRPAHRRRRAAVLGERPDLLGTIPAAPLVAGVEAAELGTGGSAGYTNRRKSGQERILAFIRMGVYIEGVLEAVATPTRWELYRVLAEPVRLRLLALAAAEELAIGELAGLLGESQPNISRHLTPLKQAGLVLVRREGTRGLVRIADAAAADPVVEIGRAHV